METRSRFGVSGALIAAGVLVGLAFFGLRSGSVEVVVDPGPAVAAPETGEAVVTHLRASGGFAPFGLRIIDSTHTVEVQFTTGPGCSDRIADAETWPVPYPECANSNGVTGEVSGYGITASGRSLVGVSFPVSRDCWERLEQGMAWPSSIPECLDHG